MDSEEGVDFGIATFDQVYSLDTVEACRLVFLTVSFL